MTNSKFHAPTKLQKAKDDALLADIKQQRKAGTYPADDDFDGEQKNTLEGGKNE